MLELAQHPDDSGDMLSNRPTLLHRSTRMFKIQEPDSAIKRVLSTLTIHRNGVDVVVRFAGANMPEGTQQAYEERMRRMRAQR